MAGIITGQCRCGGVVYRGDRADVPMFRCYCRDCQQLTGAGHSEMMPLLAASFSTVGTLKEFEMTAASGLSTWGGFCPDCGSPLTRRSERSPERVYVHAGSLAMPNDYRPEMVIYGDSAQAWDLPPE